jgi:hypothetical protein
MIPMKRNLTFNLINLCLVFILTIPLKLNAIPAFSRKYQISCQECHLLVARLKPFGEEFEGNGFRLTEYESPRYFIQTGDDKLSLFRELPVALRIDAAASYNFDNKRTVDFETPYGLKLLSGGELSGKISYYLSFLLSDGGKTTGIEQAYLMYNNLFGTGINFTVGQFQACDPLYKRESRFTLEDVIILKDAPGNSSVSLDFDRGIMFDYEIPKLGTSFCVAVVNGNGAGSASQGFLFDKDKFKNVTGRISQPIGKSLSVGFLGYIGKERIDAPSLLTSQNSSIRMFGADLKLGINERFMLNAQYVRRTDQWAFIESDDIMKAAVRTEGGFAELIFTPKGDKSKWYLEGLLNWVDSDDSSLNYRSETLHAGYLLRRNVRLFIEYTWLSEIKEYGRFNLGFVTAF